MTLQPYAEQYVFSPQSPSTSEDVLYIYAVAAKIACKYPLSAKEIDQTLRKAVQSLIPPESFTSAECWKWWERFMQAISHSNTNNTQNIGILFCEKLENIAQQVDLPPRIEWHKLPESYSMATDTNVVPTRTCIADAEELFQLLHSIQCYSSTKTKIPLDVEGGRFFFEKIIQMNEPLWQIFASYVYEREILQRNDILLLQRYRAKKIPFHSQDIAIMEIFEALLKSIKT